MKTPLLPFTLFALVLSVSLLAQGLPAEPPASAVEPGDTPAPVVPAEDVEDILDDNEMPAEGAPEPVLLSASCPPLPNLQVCYDYCDAHEDRCIEDCVLFPYNDSCVEDCFDFADQCAQDCQASCS